MSEKKSQLVVSVLGNSAKEKLVYSIEETSSHRFHFFTDDKNESQNIDLIITTDGDSIFCHVLEVLNYNVHFEYLSHPILKRKIDKGKVDRIINDYMSANRAIMDPKIDLPPSTAAVRDKKELLYKWRWGVSGGSAVMTSKIDSQSKYRDYERELSNGLGLQMEVSRYVSRNWSIGVIVDGFIKNGDFGEIEIRDESSGETISGPRSDRIQSMYYGLLMNVGLPNRVTKADANFKFGPGFHVYRNNAEIVIPVQLRGENIGAMVGCDFGVMAGRHLSFQLSFSYFRGGFDRLESDNGSNVSIISLGSTKKRLDHFNFGLGLRWYPEALK